MFGMMDLFLNYYKEVILNVYKVNNFVCKHIAFPSTRSIKSLLAEYYSLLCKVVDHNQSLRINNSKENLISHFIKQQNT